jgi:hypothetical protein
MTPHLPPTCERALLERFLKAEAMILWAIRAAQKKDVPPEVLQFLRRHEEEESRHLQHFEAMLGISSHRQKTLPRVPSQWWALAVQLYGYEALGLEFGKLLVAARPDLSAIVADEESHVAFFENQVRGILASGGPSAEGARQYAQGWRRRLPPTVDRYLEDPTLTPFREELRVSILNAIDERFAAVGLTANQ